MCLSFRLDIIQKFEELLARRTILRPSTVRGLTELPHILALLLAVLAEGKIERRYRLRADSLSRPGVCLARAGHLESIAATDLEELVRDIEVGGGVRSVERLLGADRPCNSVGIR